jgi:hypothetical protein
MEISENQYAQTLLMSQLRSNFLVDPFREFAKILRSLEQFIQTVKGQNNF